jgi:hypothetical protein
MNEHTHCHFDCTSLKMPPAVSQSVNSFTEERVLQLLNLYTFRRSLQTELTPPEFDPQVMSIVESYNRTDLSRGLPSSHHFLDAERTKERAVTLCRGFLEPKASSHTVTERVQSFDARFGQLLKTHFQVKEPSDIPIQRTCHLLERLPATAPPLQCNEHEDRLATPPLDGQRSSPLCTSNESMATQYIDSNTIRFTLHIVLSQGDGTNWSPVYQKLVNLCGDLLAGALAISSVQEETEFLLSDVYLLQSFLWSAWQRCIMLYLWVVMGNHIESDFGDRSGIFAFDNMPLLKRLIADANVISASSDDLEMGLNEPYMCQWAFRLLSEDAGSVSQDFRQFYVRYNDIFKLQEPRCKPSVGGPHVTQQQCSGDSPFSCNRFKGMKILDQSAHTPLCGQTCKKLFWDENSYRRTDGPRAVDIQQAQSEKIIYRRATEKTMAISHVWSHGQGGRPEPLEEKGTGFNHCLHERYRQVAETLECDTYWMDTPCIPQDHRLRREAIGHINRIFADAKVTLVCDRDIMMIDVDPHYEGRDTHTWRKKIEASDIPIALQESLMIALLVCDWNLRAWTFLEAMRGGRNICLLCSNDNIVVLNDIVRNVYHHGRVDISTLYVNALHLLPALKVDLYSVVATRQAKEAGMSESVDLLQATYLLSHRHASRKGDEVVIWSLLCGKTPCFNATDLWTAHLGGFVPTEYLMNNLPRIRKSLKGRGKNFGWAPCRPDFPEDWDVVKNTRYYAPESSSFCTYGNILKDGLQGRWLFWDFNCRWICRAFSHRADPLQQTLYNIVDKYLRCYPCGALVRPCTMAEDPLIYRGTAGGTLLAVVGTYTGRRYHWRGLMDWPKTVPLPSMWVEEILIA